MQSKLSNDIQSELERLVEDAKPYNIRISTDNGTMFKNNEGESLIKATLWKGGKVVSRDVSWRWALDGVVTVGMQYRVQAKDITDTAVLTVSGYVGNTEVATTEITLANMVEQIDLVILTSNGNTFKNGVIASTLTATLWRGNKEIDKDGTEFSYVWKKVNSDETPDEHWNADHSYSQKSIRITETDVFRRATFSCEVQYVGKRV